MNLRTNSNSFPIQRTFIGFSNRIFTGIFAAQYKLMLYT